MTIAVNNRNEFVNVDEVSGDEGAKEIVDYSGDATEEKREREEGPGRYDGLTVPEKVPPITDLKGKLPSHCFRPDLARSLKYVAKDLLVSSSLYAFIIFVEKSALPLIFQWLVFPIYWFLQGTMMWAMFVLAHDCGHGSFSNSSVVNEIVGNFLNSLILVPFYPWKLSHQHHHKNTGNIDKDEIFYPVREKQVPLKDQGKSIKLFWLGFGWFYYLVKGFQPRPVSHLNAYNPLFVKHAGKCVISLCCNLAWVGVLFTYSQSYGFSKLLVHYLIPVFVFGSWLVVTTFLHHHDDDVPWYADHKWDYVRGQLSSVDRDYGWAHSLVHNIGTHQMHHMFTKIPHYHLEEATAAFRRAYPELVRINNEPILSEFFRRFNIYDSDKYIPDDKEFHVFGGVKEATKKKTWIVVWTRLDLNVAIGVQGLI